MASLVTGADDVVILKAGWIFRQKPLFKKWKKCWLVVTLGGNLRYYSSKRSASSQSELDLKTNCMTIKYGKQCRTLLPPIGVDVGCLMELYFTGGRKLNLCAHDLDSAHLWMQAIARAQAEKALPTPKYSRKNRTKEDALKEDSQKENLRQQKRWYMVLCCGGKNTVQNFTTPRAPTQSSWT